MLNLICIRTSFTLLMGAKTFNGVLEQIMPSYITPTKIGISHIRIAFPHTFCMIIIKKPSELG